MTDRIALDDLTSDALDQLYAELDQLRADLVAARTQHLPADIAKHYQHAVDAAVAAEQRAETAEAKVKKQAVRIEEYRKSRRRWMDAAYADRKTALEQQQRAERAEASIERVRALAERWKFTGDRKNGPLRELIAALDEHQEQPPAPAVHTGGNAEDCPACDGTNPPYPFLCPGP